ncbi:MAG TPA: ABC transporter permease [Bryobacteraceae bacterium]|nr:ABC transporter permease [Bryobacteraceae bacterium]
MSITKIWRRLLFLTRRNRMDDDLAEEMRLHMDLRTARLQQQGLEACDAALTARQRFGNSAVLRETSHDSWGWRWLEESWQDLRFGLRMLIRTPAFSATVIITLGLGIGASTAIFNVVNGVLLKGLPFREPDRLVTLYEQMSKRAIRKFTFSPPDYIALTQQNEWFSSVGAFRNLDYEISGSGTPERVQGARLTASLLPTLGVEPFLGRNFTEMEDNDDRDVVLISHAFWVRKFARDPSVIGRGLRVNRRTVTVIGVLPPTFVFPPRGLFRNGQPADIFRTMSFTADQRQAYGRQYNHSVVARLKPGVTIEQSQAAAPVLARRFEERYPAFYHRMPGFSLGVSVVPFRNEIIGNVQTLLWVMLAAVLMVLLIGCADVASLMLARATGRAREMAIRVSLGAGRFRLIRQVLIEGGVLAILGGALGVLLAAIATSALLAASPIPLPRSEAVAMNQHALLFAAAVSILSALLFGLVPALESARGAAADALREGGQGRTQGLRRRRWLRSFVAVQVAMAVVLAVGAGLLMRSFTKLLEVNPGFQPQHVLGFSLNLPIQAYAQATQVTGFWERLRESLSAIPGVEAVGVGDLPLAVRELRGIWPEDMSAFPSNPPSIRQSWTHGDYLRALGVPLKQGRWFTDGDVKGSQLVIVINETMARMFYPGKNPIGQRVKWGGSAESRSPWMTVVGVVGDFKQESLQEHTAPMTFTPIMQEPDESIFMSRNMNVAVRTSADPSAIATAVRKHVAELDPSLPVAGLKTMEDAVRQAAAPQRFSTWLLGVFAGIALLLATLGIGGVVAYTVGQRTREIGLRIALGAPRGTILSLMLREGLLYAGIGVSAGIALALASTRLMGTLLYGVQPTDTLTFAAVMGVVALVAAAASLLPAFRATRVDPMVALRSE